MTKKKKDKSTNNDLKTLHINTEKTWPNVVQPMRKRPTKLALSQCLSNIVMPTKLTLSHFCAHNASEMSIK